MAIVLGDDSSLYSRTAGPAAQLAWSEERWTLGAVLHYVSDKLLT